MSETVPEATTAEAPSPAVAEPAETVAEAAGEEPTTPQNREPDPTRFEDQDVKPAETSAEEVDLESQRKDETSSLATDRYDEFGQRIVE